MDEARFMDPSAWTFNSEMSSEERTVEGTRFEVVNNADGRFQWKMWFRGGPEVFGNSFDRQDDAKRDAWNAYQRRSQEEALSEKEDQEKAKQSHPDELL